MLVTLALLALTQDDFTLTYEKSRFLGTGRYEEAVRFCERLEKVSPYAHVLRYGTSPEGRPMVAILVGRDNNFHLSPKPLIFIENGIHSGEIEGKDATLILLREMLVSKTKANLLDTANFLVVPVFGLDAHERFNAYNRINQNGPTEMGWRVNAQNLNLNRDFVKADAGEMKAQITLLHQFKPDFFFDNHTTDGADFQYPLTLGIPVAQTLDEGVRKWAIAYSAAVVQDLEKKDGILAAPYFDLVSEGDPSNGLSVQDFGPRYSNGYLSSLDRPSVLVETHMLKPYKQRVDATYSVMLRTIEYVEAHGAALKLANMGADRAAMQAAGKSYVVDVAGDGTKRPFNFKGYVFKPYHSDVSGSEIPGWDHSKPIDIPCQIQDSYKPSVTVTAPAAYVIPAPWVDAIDRLGLHRVKFRRLMSPVTASFESFRFSEVKFPSQPFEGRFMPTFNLTEISEERTLPTGSAVVTLNQKNVRLILQMLEPAAPDSLAHWGFFNAIFERKEYFERYAMEPIARKMLESDPKLKAEFDEKLKDEAFAKNSNARLGFFYDRSPYADSRMNKYPVVRVRADQVSLLK